MEVAWVVVVAGTRSDIEFRFRPYGTTASEEDRQVGLYLGRILKGTRSAGAAV
jgi:hypothetical protein